MVEIIKGNFGECRIIDCLDQTTGIPSLQDSFELCFTDPDYGLKHDRKGVPFREKTQMDWDFHGAWFQAVEKISDAQVFTCGITHFYEWIKKFTPNYKHRIWYKPNVESMLTYEPILFYGKLKRIHSIPYTFVHNIKTIEYSLNHPYPKPFDLVLDLISRIKPANVIDPFMGSGTTAEVCEYLGIPWLGFEIDKTYVTDIMTRIEKGKYAYKTNKKQIPLTKFLS